MAWLNVLTQEDLVDHDFIDRWCYGYDELKERVADMTPARAAEITGVPEEQIIRAARMYGNAKPSSIAWGLAVDQSVNGVQLGQCLIALMAITGFVDAPGGTQLGAMWRPYEDEGKTDVDAEGNVRSHKKKKSVANVQMASAPNVALHEGIMTEELLAKRIGLDKHPAVTAIIWTADPDDFLEQLESGDPYEIHMAMFSSSNPCGAAISADPHRWYENLKKLDFNFATETFMNPTVMGTCDVVLPLASTIEHNAMVVTHYGMNASFYGAENKCIQVGECKSDVEIMIALGKRMHPEFWDQFENEDQYNEFNGLPGGVTWEELRDSVTIMTDEPYYKYKLGWLRKDNQPGFPTRTGRIELYASLYDHFGDDPLPYYLDPPFGPESTPELMEKFPFILTTGARTYVSFHSEHRQVPSLRQIVPDPLLDINPADAERLGISDGDWVDIESPFGKVKLASPRPLRKGSCMRCMAGGSPRRTPRCRISMATGNRTSTC